MGSQTDLVHLQLQSGEPWHPRWNWLIDKPGRTGPGTRYTVSAILLFNGIVAGVLQLTPVFGPPESTLGLALSILGLCLIPGALLFAWSAIRLQKYKRSRAI